MAAKISPDTISMSEFERLLAAWARQIFRALKAEDWEATQEARFQFLHLLVCFLPRHLSQDPRWGENNSFLDCLGGAPIDLVLPTWLRVHDEVWIMLNDPYIGSGKSSYSCGTREPFEFEIDLCGQTGDLLGYSMKFGDPVRLSNSADNDGRDKTGWAFTFERGISREESSVLNFSNAEVVYLNRDGRMQAEPSESAPDDKYDDSIAGSMNCFLERISTYARLLSHARAARDQDAIDQSLHGLQYQIDSAISYRRRAGLATTLIGT